MKTLNILFTFIFMGWHIAHCQTLITVDNNPNNAAQFSDLQTAVDSAASGSTIYVQGSSVSYGSVVVNKPLTFIGPGRDPQNQGGMRADIRGLHLLEHADGCQFYGLTIHKVLAGSGNVPYPQIDNLVFDGIIFQQDQQLSGDNILIRNSIIGYPFTRSDYRVNNLKENAQNILIENNFIAVRLSAFAHHSIQVKNNVFIHPSNMPTRFAFGNCATINVENNIFYNSSPGQCNYVSFHNNLTYFTQYDSLPYGTNNGENNIIATDPQFLNAPHPTNFLTFDLYAQDWHLSPSSPAAGAGSDGTDIGIYGGSRPFTPGGDPPVPVIRRFKIPNSIVPPGGLLQIELIATRPN